MSGTETKIPCLLNHADINRDADLSFLIQNSPDRILSTSQKLALYLAIYGRMNLFITGSSGVGKSEVLKLLNEVYKSQNLAIQFTSTTGVSATLLPNGITLHSFLRLRPNEFNVEKIVASAESNVILQERLQPLKCLVIDEVSMLTARNFELLHLICSSVRKNKEPFGGIQIILVGDFAQLSPIKDFIPENNKGRE